MSSSLRRVSTANLALLDFQVRPALVLLKLKRLGRRYIDIIFSVLFNNTRGRDMNTLNQNLFVFGYFDGSQFTKLTASRCEDKIRRLHNWW